MSLTVLKFVLKFKKSVVLIIFVMFMLFSRDLNEFRELTQWTGRASELHSGALVRGSKKRSVTENILGCERRCATTGSSGIVLVSGMSTRLCASLYMRVYLINTISIQTHLYS